MTDYKTLKNKLLKDPEIKRAYDQLEPEFVLARELIKKRLAKNLTQNGLAKIVGTKQPSIARLESGQSNPTISFLNKVALALGGKLQIAIN